MNKIPLAERLRPTSLDTYMGQEQLIGEGASLRKAIDSGFIPSLILWGPPGVGKTTLANIIANELKRPFYTLSAINSGVKDIRDIINKVKNQGMFGGSNAIMFIDEIHRFSKSQQDSLLGAVEKGIITLIGATTENPSFEVIPALLSRSQVYVLEHFSKQNLDDLIKKAVADDVVLSKKDIEVIETDALIGLSGGDARKLLNLLELVINSAGEGKIKMDNELVSSLIKNKTILYDKSGEQHYDVISAFIKSIRGSDPNAALYYLARMIEGGEDAKFIARRLLILSSEDIGNANPTALIMANNCFQAVNIIGFPESRIILSQCVTYLACSAKSNASYVAISAAQQLVKETGNLPIPLHLRNAPTKLMKELNYGVNYKYAHNHEGNFVNQEFFPEEISGTKLFDPSNNTRENEMRKNLRATWKERYGY
ncbi:replication-associated recombination protein A [Flavobacteriales bacterium]|jgi:putative ATPase|nr:replication-associated recombination protein A [Flavobacteriales bacterium]MDB4052140.1 replication-associated recombination protein A [Flavobacteriales bacterium]MDB9702396.1 replication-associated recombination protein A [Flavobacteriales bacterium]MDC1370465.1 replication-associated recombination protein A [Flavobacteriales bacterium]